MNKRRPRPPRCDPATTQALCTGYETGSPIHALAAEHQLTRHTVRATLIEDGVELRRGGNPRGSRIGGARAERRAALVAQVAAAYTQGASSRALATTFELSYTTVRNYVREAGGTLRPRGGGGSRASAERRVERREQVVAAYTRGASISAVAAAHGVSRTTVRRDLVAAGVMS